MGGGQRGYERAGALRRVRPRRGGAGMDEQGWVVSPLSCSRARTLLPALCVGAPDARLVRALRRVRRDDRERGGGRGHGWRFFPDPLGQLQPRCPECSSASRRLAQLEASGTGATDRPCGPTDRSSDDRPTPTNRHQCSVAAFSSHRSSAFAHVVVPGAAALDIADANPTAGVVGQPYWSHLPALAGQWERRRIVERQGRIASSRPSSLVQRSHCARLRHADAGGVVQLLPRGARRAWPVGLLHPGGVHDRRRGGPQHRQRLARAAASARSTAISCRPPEARQPVGPDRRRAAGRGPQRAGAITGTPAQTVSRPSPCVRATSRAATKQFTLHVVEPLVVTAPPAKAIRLGRSFLLTLLPAAARTVRWSSPSLPPGINVNDHRSGRRTPAGLGTLTLTLTPRTRSGYRRASRRPSRWSDDSRS